jgi:hypothetical protein
MAGVPDRVRLRRKPEGRRFDSFRARHFSPMFFVYVLYSSTTNRRYIGVTTQSPKKTNQFPN